MNERGHRHHDASMLSVEEALERILGFFDVLGAEVNPILEAQGQVLAEDIVSRFDIPPLVNSAMDGYAVKAGSVEGATRASPSVLRVVGGVAAGRLPQVEVTPGTSVRIMTGAPVPEGADAVVPFEETDEADRAASGSWPPSDIGIYAEVAASTNLRPAGQDIKKGQRVLQKGTVLRPPEIGVLASLGLSEVSVVRRPVVAILATGDELVEPQDGLAPGKIYNSNSYGVAAAVVGAGGVPKMLGIAPDDLKAVGVKIREGLSSDMLITSAGVSKGDYDVVKDVLSEHGEIEFWSVRMRPAKPLAFGVLHGLAGRALPHLGLPGNPVSALVAFEQFGRPAIYKMLGLKHASRPTVEAVLEEPIDNPDGRRVYARAIVTKRNGTYYARLTGHQSSNLLTSMVRANGLAICPEDLPEKKAGEKVEVVMLDWPESVF